MNDETIAPRDTSELLSDCVHCGFCLPVCPTYASWGDEMDSPRGRIDLMRGLDEDEFALGAEVVAPIDACLGCMACVTACPSGVRYDLLIETTRAEVERTYERPAADRRFRDAVFAIFPYPARLRLAVVPLRLYVNSKLQALVRATGITRFLPPRLRALEALATAPPPHAELRARTPASGERRATVALLTGCVQSVFFPNVNAATVRVFAAEGCDVVVPPRQGCCGALSLHAGRLDEAKRFAKALMTRFDDDETPVLVNAAGCGSTLKGYGELFADDAEWHERAIRFALRVRDVSEHLATLDARAPRHPIAARVAYHDACHLAHAQRVRAEPRALLAAIPQLDVLEIPRGDQCCGSAGTYNLFEPESAREIGERKVDAVLSVAPDLVASANPGCTLQMQSILRDRPGGGTLRAAHPIEIVDASIRNRPLA